MTRGTVRILTFFNAAILVAVILVTPVVTMASGSISSTYSPERVGVNCAVLRGSVGNSYGTNTRVWFEYGKDVKHRSFATRHQYTSENSQNFSQKVERLSPQTTYYYQIVAENSLGRVYGNQVSFKTGAVSDSSVKTYCDERDGASTFFSGSTIPSGGNNTTQGNVSPSPSVNVSGITDNRAQLNAVVYPISGIQTTGWFEWGKTPDLGNKTPQKMLGAGSPFVMSETVSNLQQGTTYFYKPIIQSAYGAKEGLLYSFRTTGTSPSSVGTVQKNENDYSFESENAPSQTSSDKKTDTKPIAKSEKNTKETDSSEENKSGTSTFGAVAAAAAADGNPFFSLGTWVIFIGNILFLCAIYFLYVFFSDKKDDIGYVGNGEEIKNSTLIADFAKAPVEKREATPKGAPPANLPI